MSTFNDPEGAIVQIIDEEHAVAGCTLTLHLWDEGWIYVIVRGERQLDSGPRTAAARLFSTSRAAAEQLGRERLAEISS